MKFDSEKINSVLEKVDEERRVGGGESECGSEIGVGVDVKNEESITHPSSLTTTTTATHSAHTATATSTSTVTATTSTLPEVRSIFPLLDTGMDINEAFLDPFSFTHRYPTHNTDDNKNNISKSRLPSTDAISYKNKILTEKEQNKYSRDLRSLSALEITLQLLRNSDPESWETEERIAIISSLVDKVSESADLKIKRSNECQEKRSRRERVNQRIDDIPDEPCVPLTAEIVKVRSHRK